MLSNCGAREDSSEALGQHGNQTINPKGNQSWIFTGRTDAEAPAPIFWPPDVKSQLIGKDPDSGKDWEQEEKGVTGWDSWRVSPTQSTWIWANSERWWRPGKPDMLQSMGLQRVGHDLVTEQQHTYLSVHSIGEGNGTPLQYSCLENPMDEEPGRLQSMGSWRVRHNWETSLSLFTSMHWRRKWQPTPVFLSGESQGRGSLVGCHLWGHTESYTTEVT